MNKPFIVLSLKIPGFYLFSLLQLLLQFNCQLCAAGGLCVAYIQLHLPHLRGAQLDQGLFQLLTQ